MKRETIWNAREYLFRERLTVDHDTAGLWQPEAVQRAPGGWGGRAVLAKEPSVERREGSRTSLPAL